MFPWVYGFEWNAGTIIFLGAFFTVATIVIVTVSLAIVRSWRAFRDHSVSAVGWKAIFHDLPESARYCRHELSGEFEHRTCKHGFQCRDCRTHQGLLSARAADATGTPPETSTPPVGETFYHRGHAWVRFEGDQTVTVGLDDLATWLVGIRATVELPRVGRRIHENGVAWRFRLGGETVRVLAPVSGRVEAVGSREEGWYLKVRLEQNPPSFAHLLSGEEAAAWRRREIERIRNLLPRSCRECLSPEGPTCETTSLACDPVDWSGICGETLLEG